MGSASLTRRRAGPRASRTDFAELALARYAHEPLNDRVWALRDNLTAYDATFVALAELLGAPLVTCDAKVADAPGHTARIEVFAEPPRRGRASCT